MTERAAYAAAGVDVAAGDRAVELLKSRMKVSQLDMLGGIGAFGAVLSVPEGIRQPLLVAATDGVGTKTEIARRLGRFDTIGWDLVAMCADDVVCHGAMPTYFLDYVAVGRVVPERVAEIVGGVADACESIACALVGGETAEHPGLMEDDSFDLAGFCLGFVERDELIDGSAALAGDIVIGLESSGLHANGYSLVRALIEDNRLTLDEELLTPTRTYAPAVLDLLSTLRHNEIRIGGLAHVTGGGLAGNLPRAVGPGLSVVLDTQSWSMPEIFQRIGTVAGMDAAELRATLNCGIGFAVVVQPEVAEAAIDMLARSGVNSWQIGEVVPRDELGNARYAEA